MRPAAMDVLKSGGVGVVGEDELNVKITPKCGRVTGTGGGRRGTGGPELFHIWSERRAGTPANTRHGCIQLHYMTIK